MRNCGYKETLREVLQLHITCHFVTGYNFVTSEIITGEVVNSFLVGYFRSSRGLKQGDHLSPYIFSMATKSLS